MIASLKAMEVVVITGVTAAIAPWVMIMAYNPFKNKYIFILISIILCLFLIFNIIIQWTSWKGIYNTNYTMYVIISNILLLIKYIIFSTIVSLSLYDNLRDIDKYDIKSIQFFKQNLLFQVDDIKTLAIFMRVVLQNNNTIYCKSYNVNDEIQYCIKNKINVINNIIINEIPQISSIDKVKYNYITKVDYEAININNNVVKVPLKYDFYLEYIIINTGFVNYKIITRNKNINIPNAYQVQSVNLQELIEIIQQNQNVSIWYKQNIIDYTQIKYISKIFSKYNNHQKIINNNLRQEEVIYNNKQYASPHYLVAVLANCKVYICYVRDMLTTQIKDYLHLPSFQIEDCVNIQNL